MGSYKNIIKADYLQRTRSYAFLITLLVSFCVAQSFIPPHNANYSTVRIGSYIGNNNGAWIGHVTAIMASTFLWLIGFYLVNNGIRRDSETGAGQIIAATPITNFGYLYAKALSNFCVLLTILLTIILMAFGLYAVRGDAGDFSIAQFMLPHLLAAVPGVFLVSVLAVLFEVLFGSKTNLINISFFFLFMLMVGLTNTIKNPLLFGLDPLGVKFITSSMSDTVKMQFGGEPQGIAVGYIFGRKELFKYFEFKGTAWSAVYVLSRLIWIAIGFGLLVFASKIFNRFDSKPVVRVRSKIAPVAASQAPAIIRDIQLAAIPKAVSNFSIYPLVKTEIKMLIRKGPRWFWMVNLGLMILLGLIPVSMAHKIALPVLWLLQINRWADIAVKEKQNRTHFFMFSAYKPLQRLLTSQLIAAVILAVFLALPLIIRYLLLGSFYEPAAIISGALLLISFAACCGIVSGGKRLFEVLFFAVTYSLISGASFLDYLGTTNRGANYFVILFMLSAGILITSYMARKYEIKHQ